MTWQLPYPSGRQPVLARNVVSTSQPLAAQAGAAAFARGGNAIDAALAAAITLTVVEPVMNGIGGDAFALVWDGAALHGLNASGRAPRAWSAERFAHLPQMPRIGWDTVTTPGGVAGWVALSERFGALPFEDLFTDAIRHARDGFPVSPVIARQWAQAAIDLKGQPGFEAFTPGGRAPQAGEIWRFADQADTLADIARTRGASFYRGRLAQAMADFAHQHGAGLALEDLAAHAVEWVQPISVPFGDRTVHEIPPNGQGIAALMALGLLEHLPYRSTAAGSAARMHLEIEAMRVAFADLYAHVADPAHMRLTPAQLLDPAYLRQRAALIDPQRAGQYPAGQPGSGGTVYLCTADSEGRMVSFIQSNFKGFGSGVVVPGTGIALHNRGMGFVTTPGHPNQVAGGKRPMHSIIPAFVTRGGQPHMAFGVMGGNMQAQGHVQMVLREAVEGLNPQACSDAPRWRINDAGALTLEHTVPAAVVDGLRALGHDPQVAAPGSLEFGSAQIIRRLEATPGTGFAYAAGSDHRRDGQAVGC
ncbi:gamma-glutamyltransferase [Diaphorobacter nitroreducens]|uniref:gamma-glutamyltransferase family protein n=1 Tax=Diaphorobacter nitroreducens TaxID=164759 RepID=UPI000B59D261|nr:gamma-glutamyltransferase family protein [Diaphorobacter nitroreducens]ASI69709.1 gamma-glutamyltransferase [Diaphorobacter nitroreducens]